MSLRSHRRLVLSVVIAPVLFALVGMARFEEIRHPLRRFAPPAAAPQRPARPAPALRAAAVPRLAEAIVPRVTEREHATNAWFTSTTSLRVNPLAVVHAVAPLQAVVDTFTLKRELVDTGSYNAIYDLTANCGRFTGGCTVSQSSAMLVPGDSARVTLRYVADSNVMAANDVRVKAVRRGAWAQADSGTIRVSVVDSMAPEIAFANPAQGQVLTAESFLATVSVCDRDGTIRSASITLNDNSVGPPFAVTTAIGCRAAMAGTWRLYAASGTNTLTVTVTDGVHTTTRTRSFTYDPTDELKPIVMPTSPTESVLISAGGVDTFLVRNPRVSNPAVAYDAGTTYTLSVSCTVFAVGCSVSPSEILAYSDSEGTKVVVSRSGYTGSNPSGAVLSLTASYTGPLGRTVSTTGTKTLNAIAGAAPTLTLAPLEGAEISSTYPVTVGWCASSPLTTHDVYVDSTKLSDVYVAGSPTTECPYKGTSSYPSVTFHPWWQTISAVAVDGNNRRTSVGHAVVYDAWIADNFVVITPGGATATYAPGSAQSQLFTITNPATAGNYAAVYTSCSGSVPCNEYRYDYLKNILPGTSDTVRVFFTMPSTPAVTENVSLLALRFQDLYSSGLGYDSGTVIVSTPSYASLYQAQVTPKSGTWTVGANLTGRFAFTVKNLGTETATYTIPVPTLTGGFTIPTSAQTPGTVTVLPGETVQIPVQITAPSTSGTSGTVKIVIGVTSPGGLVAKDSGTVSLLSRTPTNLLSVSPKTGTIYQPPSATGYYPFTVTNSGNEPALFAYAATCGGYVASCSVQGPATWLQPGASGTVTVTFTPAASYAAADSTRLRLVATSGSVVDIGQVQVLPVTVAATGKFLSRADTVIHINPDSNYVWQAIAVAARNDAGSARFIRWSVDCGMSSPYTCVGSSPQFAWVGAASMVSLPLAIATGASTPVNHAMHVYAELGNLSGETFVPERADTLALYVRYEHAAPPTVHLATRARSVAPYQTATDTFYVTNRTNDPDNLYLENYLFTANCGRFTGGCALSAASATLYPGDSTRVLVTYHADSIVTGANPVSLKAVRAFSSDMDSAAVRVSVIDAAAPTITIAGPTAGSTVTTRQYLATITACDTDGEIRTTNVTLNGIPVGPPMTPATTAGCHGSKSGNFPLVLRPGADTLVATASDGIHTTTLARVFSYDDAPQLQPVVLAQAASIKIPLNSTVADTFYVRNPGPATAIYTDSASCTGFAAGCTVLPAQLLVPAGQTARVTVTKGSSGGTAGSATLTLVVKYVSATGHTVTTSASNTLVNASGARPTIALLPYSESRVTSASTPVTVSWCAQSAFASHTVAIDSLLLSDTFIPQTKSGCVAAGTSTWTGVSLKPGTQVIEAVATDASGFRTSATSVITYDAPLASLRPLVTPKNTTLPVQRSVATSQLFEVTNPTTIPARYALSASCGSFTGCAMYRPGALDLVPGGKDTVRVYFTPAATPQVTAPIKLVAAYTAPSGGMVADTAVVMASTPSLNALYQPRLTPVYSAATLDPYTNIYFTYPTLTNVGTDTAVYAINTVLPSGFVIASFPLPDSVTLAPGASYTGASNAIVTSTAVSGHDFVMMVNARDASSGDAFAFADVTLLVNRSTLSVHVDPKAQSVLYPRSTTTTIPFTVSNDGSSTTTYAISKSCGGFIASCSLTTPGESSITLAQNATRTVNVTVQTAATYTAGDNTILRLVAGFTSGGTTKTDTGMVDIHPTTPTTPSVAVAIAQSTLTLDADLDRTQTFTIQNSGPATATFGYAVSCTGGGITCGLVGTTATTGVTEPIAGSTGSANVAVRFRTGSTRGQTGVVTLRAWQTTDSVTANAVGALTINIAASTPVMAVANAINPGTAVSRGSCLTIAVSEAAAYECGELRVVHSLPVTTTMGKVRAPTLVYSSRAGSPSVMLAANVSVANGADSIKAVVTTPASPTEKIVASLQYGWPTTTQAATNRITVPLDTGIATFATGVYHYSLQITAYKAGVPITSAPDTGSFVVVKRSDSPFGRGWWLDGLESITPVDSYQKLWVGGDGSTRVYRRSNTTDSVFRVIPAIDRPDTLIQHADGSGYRRRLRSGAYVEFNNTGKHTRTRDVFAQVTTFTWDSLLTRITLPVPSGGTDRAYTFTYAPDSTAQHSARVTAIHAPGISGDDRVTTLKTLADGTVREIRYLPSSDTLSRLVSFTYDNATTARRLVTRTDRMGYVATFMYNAFGGLDSTIMAMGTTGANITHGFCTAETLSLVACSGTPEPLSNAVTRWNGPRTDVADITRFYINRFGAPDTTINALGHVTRVQRDTNWPLLAAFVTEPNGHQTRTTYDATRALPLTLTDVAPYGGDNAETSYTWHAKWDHPIGIVGPTGEGTNYIYSDSFPKVLTLTDRRGDSSRYHFTYTSANQLASSESPANLTTHVQLEYDASLGNLWRSTSALGVASWTHSDAIGRVDSVYSPIDATHRMVKTIAYDALDRVREELEMGATTATDSSSLKVTNQYDLNDNLKRVTQLGTPDPGGIGTVSRGFSYDAAGRKIAESLFHGSYEEELLHWYYDAAGNVTRGGRDAVNVDLTYDALNRLQARGGANAATYTYDAMGRVLTANNDAARISRTYYPNGLLKADTIRIAAADFSAHDFSQHVYGLKFAYDSSGRRIRLEQSGFAFESAGVLQYSYVAGNGQLETVTDETGLQYRYAYDWAGRLNTLTSRYGRSDALVETRKYDEDSRLRKRSITVGGATIRNDSLDYDLRNKIVKRFDDGGLTDLMAYDGRGRAVSTNFGGVQEQMTIDGLGNVRQKTGIYAGPTPVVSTYEAGSGRLLSQASGYSAPFPVTNYGFHPNGNLLVSTGLAEQQITLGCETCVGTVTLRSADTNTYDDRNKLVRHQFVYDTVGAAISAPNFDTYPSNVTKYLTVSTYRYDALGRRVYALVVRDTLCTRDASPEKTSGCASTATRTVWDGDQVLAEIQSDAHRGIDPSSLDNDHPAGMYWGTVTYVHGAGLDDPLSVSKGGYHYLPIRTWHGNYDRAVCGTTLCSTSVIDFPTRFAFGPRVTSEPAGWFGSLLNSSTDASGLTYLRNRYYDAKTGRFTQEDPIGLAGGMNLYGFGGGDPVNNSDPFGLCPPKDDNPCTIYSTGADLSKLKESSRQQLEALAQRSGHDLGISSGVEGKHTDPRHPTGLAADINEIDHVDIGQSGKVNSTRSMLLANEVANSAASMVGNRQVIWPTGNVKSATFGGTHSPQPFAPGGFLWDIHQSHVHISFYSKDEKP